MISELKFKRKRDFGRLMGECLAETFEAFYKGKEHPEAIVPVPLHPARFRQRGYNQALELAIPVARKVKLPLERRVTRVRHTEAQTSLPFDKRAKNLTNAFHCHPSLSYKHVAVLDDVVTTTETVEQLTKALIQRGVKWVDVWCCARTPHPTSPHKTSKKFERVDLQL